MMLLSLSFHDMNNSDGVYMIHILNICVCIYELKKCFCDFFFLQIKMFSYIFEDGQRAIPKREGFKQTKK